MQRGVSQLFFCLRSPVLVSFADQGLSPLILVYQLSVAPVTKETIFINNLQYSVGNLRIVLGHFLCHVFLLGFNIKWAHLTQEALG